MRRPSSPRAGNAPNPKVTPRRDAPREVTVGLRAGLAVLLARPTAVHAIAHGPLPAEAEPALRAARDRGVDVRSFGDREAEREVARLAGTSHHEGLAVLADPRPWASTAQIAERLVARGGVALALDRVRNPYNVGSILRTAAFFGVDAVILGCPAPHPGLGADAVRVAEGGAERVLLARTTDLAQTLGALAARGVRGVAAEASAEHEAQGFAFPRPLVLVVGHEREGVGDRVRAACVASVTIRGSGAVESLNVSLATAVLVAELVRGAKA